MKKSEFLNILEKHWPTYTKCNIKKSYETGSIYLPTLLDMFSIYCFRHNLQGEDIEKVRTFSEEFSEAKSYFIEG